MTPPPVDGDVNWPQQALPPGASDPAIQWQVARDLDGVEDWHGLRETTRTDGWCSDLLTHRGHDGLWADGLYGPKWTGTFYTLQTLAALGLPADDPAAQSSTEILLDRGVQADGQVSLWPSRTPDVCVAGMLIRTATAFGFRHDARVALVAERLLAQRLPDGGWNCQRARSGATHSSFHSTISVLEGLAAIGTVDQDGSEFLLDHQLFRSHTTGAVVHQGLLSFSFPRYWHYDVLRALRFFADVGWARDSRMGDSIALLRNKRGRDGWWRLGRRHTGRTWLTMEVGGRPSAAITLDALRVLRWWQGNDGMGPGEGTEPASG